MGRKHATFRNHVLVRYLRGHAVLPETPNVQALPTRCGWRQYGLVVLQRVQQDDSLSILQSVRLPLHSSNVGHIRCQAAYMELNFSVSVDFILPTSNYCNIIHLLVLYSCVTSPLHFVFLWERGTFGLHYGATLLCGMDRVCIYKCFTYWFSVRRLKKGRKKINNRVLSIFGAYTEKC